MAVNIRWSASALPEERKRRQWERIIRFQIGQDAPDLDVSLRQEDTDLLWHVDAPVAAYRERIVQALRASGKPVD